MPGGVGKENDCDVKGNHRKDKGTTPGLPADLVKRNVQIALGKAGTLPGD